MRYKLVVFDFDGTLADSFPFSMDVIGTLADAHGFKHIDRRDVDMYRGYDARKILKLVGLPLWKTPRVGMHFKALMAENISRIPLFEGVSQMLQRLWEQGITLAMVTSNSCENVSAVLGPDNMRLITYFEYGVSLFGKRRKLRRLLKRSGFERHEVIYIGDEVRDIEAVHAEEIAFGAVAWGYTKPEALWAHQPEALFTSVQELTDYLL